MRAFVIAPLLLLAGCGGSDKTRSTGGNVTLDPAALQLKPTATSVAGVDFTKAVRAFGTEPYWALDITPGKIRFEDFGMKDGEAVDWSAHPPKVTGTVAVIEARTPAGEVAIITLRGESCLEVGEEEDALPLKAEVRIGARTLTGCAGQNMVRPPLPVGHNAMR